MIRPNLRRLQTDRPLSIYCLPEKMMAVMCLSPSVKPLCGLRNADGRKQADHLLSSLHSSDPSSADRLVRKFVSSSSKTAALHALSHLLFSSSPLVVPLYRRISETHWFKWNPKLAASVISVLEKHDLADEAKTMILDSASRLKSSRELANFYCDLVDTFSERGLKQEAFECYAWVREIPYSGKRPYESMIKGLCSLGLPGEAEEVLNEMRASCFKPSAFEYRSVMQGYGRSGLFSEMKKVIAVMEMSGFSVDIVCANVVLSCYGDHGKLSEMVSWLWRMKELGISFSVRTLNTVLNSCPTVVGMMQDVKSLPLSIEALITKIESGLSPLLAVESLLVEELVSSDVLLENLEWSTLEMKLDLHGFHLASAYVILLQWLEEVKRRFNKEKVVPAEVSVICGSGKHSSTRGESPVKIMVSEMMFRMSSPIKVDRKNVGRFFAKGKAVKDWLC